MRSGIPYPQSGISSSFLPGAPDPGYTQPTTRYVSKRGLPASIVAADAATLRPQPPHWSLVILLTLMPLAIGCSCLVAAQAVFTYYVKMAAFPLGPPANALFTYYVKMAAVGLGVGGLLASVFHLGQPRRAWRIFLGWRTSWLSREALLFGGWLGCAVGTFAFPRLAPAAALAGIAALSSSVMIYVDTRRQFWRIGQTAPRFFGSAIVLGLAAALVCGAPPLFALGLGAATGLKLLIEANALEPLHRDRDTISPARNTALLIAGPLSALNCFRIVCGIASGVIAPLLLTTSSAGHAAAWAALVFSFAGEFAERALFFRAVDAPKMPGVPS